MAKRYTTLTTEEGTLKLRVSFNVAAAFEEETGVQVYGGDQAWLRRPALLRKFVHLAAQGQHEDLTEEQVGEMLVGHDFKTIAATLAEAIIGEKPTAKAGAKGKS